MVNLEFTTLPVYLLVHTYLYYVIIFFTHCIIIQIKKAPYTTAFLSRA